MHSRTFPGFQQPSFLFIYQDTCCWEPCYHLYQPNVLYNDQPVFVGHTFGKYVYYYEPSLDPGERHYAPKQDFDRFFLVVCVQPSLSSFEKYSFTEYHSFC